MADSGITKRAFAKALRELMAETPFEKITVGMICERYGMSRKSFYYHFRDKYDLVAWIFDEDFLSLMKGQSFTTWSFLDTLCGYLYENRDFYRKVLKIEGQNSFSEHFEEFISPLIQRRLQVIFGDENVPPICIDFLADGFVCCIKRWLLKKNCIPADEFVHDLKNLVEKLADSYSQHPEENQ